MSFVLKSGEEEDFMPGILSEEEMHLPGNDQTWLAYVNEKEIDTWKDLRAFVESYKAQDKDLEEKCSEDESIERVSSPQHNDDSDDSSSTASDKTFIIPLKKSILPPVLRRSQSCVGMESQRRLIERRPFVGNGRCQTIIGKPIPEPRSPQTVSRAVRPSYIPRLQPVTSMSSNYLPLALYRGSMTSSSATGLKVKDNQPRNKLSRSFGRSQLLTEYPNTPKLRENPERERIIQASRIPRLTKKAEAEKMRVVKR